MSGVTQLRAIDETTSRNGHGPDRNGSASAIPVNGRPMHHVTDDALRALVDANEPAAVFVRGGALARIRRDEHERPMVEQFGEASLRGRLARVAEFAAVSEKGARHVPPPIEIVRDVLSLGSWPLPALEGIIETPALRADGSVLATPGYDTTSKLVYMPAPGLTVPPVPELPTAEDRTRALATLVEALTDFPFEDHASRANALALMLTPVVRPAIRGQVPLALVDATKAGTGKGLLISLAASVATGREAAMLAAPAREEEWQKTLLAVVARGATFVAIDEAAELKSPTFAAVLTAPTFEGRLLGRSETVQLPQRITWVAAGNNIRVGGDLARRCYWIRLDAKTARPWQRRGFLHPDLLAWARETRGDLLAALLTLARAWFAAGQPAADTPPVGGFNEWAQIIGGILAHAHVEGFLGNLNKFYEQADQEAFEWEAFLSAIQHAYGEQTFTASELAARISDDAADSNTLLDALPGELAEARGKRPASFKTKLGQALGKRAETRFGDQGIRVQRAGEDGRSKVANWRVAVASDAELQSSQSCWGLRTTPSAPPHTSGADNSANSANSAYSDDELQALVDGMADA